MIDMLYDDKMVREHMEMISYNIVYYRGIDEK